MRLYNDTIAAFLGHAERLAREILSEECGLAVGRTRFTVNRTTWPLSIICFEDNTRWGYFDAKFFQIGLNARLAGQVSDAVLRDLLRHELAHYLVRVFHGEATTPHGAEYKAICQRFAWNEEVQAASGDLPSIQKVGDLKADAVIEKVKKLLALASSSNPHESELATLKANQLILRHHLDRSRLKDERELCVVTVMRAPKKNALMTAIYEILTHFLVKPILFYGRQEVRLEAAGTREQIDLAQYVAGFLQTELERLWKQQNLKGLRAKNSFYSGVARGYSEKLTSTRNDLTPEESRALVTIENDLAADLKIFLGGLSQSYSGQVLDSGAHEQGKAQGRSLSIRPAMKGNSGALSLLN